MLTAAPPPTQLLSLARVKLGQMTFHYILVGGSSPWSDPRLPGFSGFFRGGLWNSAWAISSGVASMGGRVAPAGEPPVEFLDVGLVGCIGSVFLFIFVRPSI